jgi:hypothetical protein
MLKGALSYKVFSVPTKKHASYQIRELPLFFKRHVFRMKNVKKQPPLFEYDDGVDHALREKQREQYIEKGEQHA